MTIETPAGRMAGKNETRAPARMSRIRPAGRKICLALAALILLLPVAALAGGVQSVLVISIDALHPAALDPETTPVMYRLMKAGAFTLEGQSTRPPLTLVSHAAMVSGIGPEAGGRRDNAWGTGQPAISGRTLFDDAGAGGFLTGFFYSKEKLGYLVTPAVDRHRMDREFSVENALAFFKGKTGKRFCFLHISGLDRVGPKEGWLSRGYMEELSFIDDSLDTLVTTVMDRGRYLILITSDHAGHGTIHGSSHPEDARLPLVAVSDTVPVAPFQDRPYRVTELRSMLNDLVFAPGVSEPVSQ